MRWPRVPKAWLWILGITLSLHLAGVAPRAISAPAPPPPAAPAPTVPELNTDKRSVALTEIVFDTFNGRYVPLSQADRPLIHRLRDAIRPIYRPRYGGPNALPWLGDDDLVLGYLSGDKAYAYPLKVLNFREIVNDVIGGVPVLVSYCPLCGSAVVFRRRIGDQTLTFGNTSALYESDMVMFDHQTGSYWFQIMGKAIVGEMTGASLEPLPSATMPWGEWKRLHPRTRLLSGDAGGPLGGPYRRDPFAGYPARLNRGRFAFPVKKGLRDKRLPPGEVVVTAEVGGAIKAYPIRLIGHRAVNDTVGGVRVVLFSRGRGGAVFRAEAGGRALTFSLRGGRFTDAETRSAWNLAGAATAGPMKGERLAQIPTRRAFWFSISGEVAGIALHMP